MDNQMTNSSEPKKWYQQTGGVVALLILFFPVGIYLMWKYQVFSKTVRWIISVFFALLIIGNMGRERKAGLTSPLSSSTTTPPVSTFQNPEPESRETLVPKEETDPVPVESEIVIPKKQRSFIEAVNAAKAEYDAASNELKKSAVRTKRGRMIQRALAGSRIVTNWVGRIKTMATNSEGKAILEIELEGSNIVVKTWNNALSDLMDNTLISQESDLFSVIAEMEQGDRVVFDGSFLPSLKNDFIQEGSITEAGSMSDPEFIFRFKSIRRY